MSMQVRPSHGRLAVSAQLPRPPLSVLCEVAALARQHNDVSLHNELLREIGKGKLEATSILNKFI